LSPVREAKAKLARALEQVTTGLRLSTCVTDAL
jgi:hypothetical protein